MEMLGKVRRMHLRDKLSLHEISKCTGLSRNTLRAPFGDQDALRVSATVKRLPASTRLAKANSVNSCAVCFAKPR
jgi:hypothetical protein